MDCGQAIAAMPDLLTGSLAEADRLQIDQHVAGCASCRAERDELAAAWQLLGEGCVDDAFERDPTFARPGSAVAPGFATVAIPRLRAAVLTAQKRRHTRRLRRVTLGSAGALLALAAGIVIVLRSASVPVATAPSDPAPVASGRAAQAPAPGVASEAPGVSLPEPLAAFMTNAPGSEGGRGQAIELVGPHFGDGQAQPPAELIEALTRTLRSDHNPGVRKKAAQALMGLPPTAEIRAAFILALRKDPNPAIRIIAVEALGRAARAFDAASIETLRERADDQHESRNLRTRAARALLTLAL
jgi:hypothetical protein